MSDWPGTTSSQQAPQAPVLPPSDSDPARATGPLDAITIVKYLFGGRDAIVRVAQDRNSLWVGGLFVAAAALAREYDAHDLVHEWWHLLLPFGASIVLSLILYQFAYLSAGRKGGFGYLAGYRSLLALFWMTAPLALLYGIPYERFMTEAGAAYANIWTLGLVSGWRVLLISRVLAVTTGKPWVRWFFGVMLFAAVAALIALTAAPLPVVQLMGGVQQSEGDRVVADTSFMVMALTVYSIPVWLLGLLISLVPWWEPKPNSARPALGHASDRGTVAPGVWTFAAVALAIWLPFIPARQREQQLRYRVQSMFARGQIGEALRYLGAHTPAEFGPYWEPPPRLGWNRPESPAMLDVMEDLVEHDAAPWVRAAYMSKFERRYLSIAYRFVPEYEQDRARIERVLARLPKSMQLSDYARQTLEYNRGEFEMLNPSTGPAATQAATQRGRP